MLLNAIEVVEKKDTITWNDKKVKIVKRSIQSRLQNDVKVKPYKTQMVLKFIAKRKKARLDRAKELLQ